MPVLIFSIAVIAILALIFFAMPRVIGELGGCHAPPAMPYTPDEAHHVWLRRINCDRHICDDKRAALAVLESKGLLQLAGDPR
jgi:hypothetical protein